MSVSKIILACGIALIASSLTQGVTAELLVKDFIQNDKSWEQQLSKERSLISIAGIKGLKTLQRLANEKTHRDLGFNSVTDANRASNGVPLCMLTLSRDRLLQFDAVKEPVDLLAEPLKIIYPVMVDGKVVSSFTLAVRKNQWRVVSYGEPVVATNLAAILDTKVMWPQLTNFLAFSDVFVAREPETELMLIGHRDATNRVQLLTVGKMTLGGEVLEAGRVLAKSNVLSLKLLLQR